MAKIARDFQRKKVYEAQRSIWDYKMPPVGNGSLQDVAGFVMQVILTLMWERLCLKYGRRVMRPFTVVEAGRKAASCSTDTLTFPSYERTMEQGYNMRQPWVICHEMAHMAIFHLLYTNMGSVSSHGPEFADAFVDIVREMLGYHEGDRLYEAFERHGVRQHVDSFRVPSPCKIENFYREYDESRYLARFRDAGKAIMVGGDDLGMNCNCKREWSE